MCNHAEVGPSVLQVELLHTEDFHRSKCSAAVQLTLLKEEKHKRVKGTLVRHTGAAQRPRWLAVITLMRIIGGEGERQSGRGASGDGMKRRRDRVQTVAARQSSCQSSKSSAPVNGSSLPLLQ